MTYAIAEEPRIDVKDRARGDVRPADCIHEAGAITSIRPLDGNDAVDGLADDDRARNALPVGEGHR